MADVLSEEISLAGNLLAKRVQDLVVQGEEPPKPYLCREDNDSISALAPIPTIDVGLLTEASSVANSDELQDLKSALCKWGCFQVVGHGMPSSLLDGMRKVTREFFEQPMEEKRRYAKGVNEYEGYGADPVPEEGQPLDWQDRLALTVYPEDNRNLRFWPENPSSFREVVDEYSSKLKAMTKLLSKAMAKCLDLEENSFINQFGEKEEFVMRFNYYSPCQMSDRVMGLKAHSDGTSYSLILQDQVQGLQILMDGTWLTVPADPEAILVLIGDQMEIMTNGTFKSPVHRVVSNSDKDRISIAMFYSPETGKEIHPEDGLISEENKPILYKPVKNYGEVYWVYYNKGQRSIHTAQV
ncbi:protein LATERAL BRANCHING OXIDOREDUCTASE 1-like [Silene latifolia]|uniref:protein LATERAL BRANCHING OXIDOREDUCTASE 1-like n=1 Tax=Silene latifolia TaxID=37657 RepID=UPI003D776C3C